jgi:hypothetical protein
MTMSRREKQLAAALESIWEAAHSATEGDTSPEETVRTIAEDAAEALADLPALCTLADE